MVAQPFCRGTSLEVRLSASLHPFHFLSERVLTPKHFRLMCAIMICKYLPGVDHMLGTTPRSLHVLSFDDHDSRVGTVTVPASWEELRQGAQQQHQCHQAPAGSSVPKVPLLLSASPCLPFPSWWFTGHPSPENSSPPFSLKNTLRRIKGPPVSSPFPEGSGV